MDLPSLHVEKGAGQGRCQHVASLWQGERRQEHPGIHPGVLHRHSSWLEQPLCERRASAGGNGAAGGVLASP